MKSTQQLFFQTAKLKSNNTHHDRMRKHIFRLTASTIIKKENEVNITHFFSDCFTNNFNFYFLLHIWKEISKTTLKIIFVKQIRKRIC